MNIEDIYKDVICVTIFSSSDLGHYIKKIKNKYSVQEWLVSVPLLLDKRNWGCKWLFKIVEESTVHEE